MGIDERKQRSLREDERAIEGLPIRLVIALFVGVAALFLMLQVLGLFNESGIEPSEITVDIDEGSVLDLSETGDDYNEDETVVFTVVGGDGSQVSTADYDGILLQPNTARGETTAISIDDTEDASVGDDGYAYDDDGEWEISVGYFAGEDDLDASLAADQNTGTYEIEPQGGTEFDEAIAVEITLID